MTAELKLLQQNPHAQDVADCLHEILAPIARIVLKRGVSWGEFEESAKVVFVEQAAEHFQIPDRKMTDSRISVITGFTRRDVKRLREISEQGIHSSKIYNANRATRVLSGWCQSQEFIDSQGEPLPLPIESDDDVNFTQLARLYAGDVPVMALVAELKRIGSVEEDTAGRLIIANRSYTPDNDNIEQVAVIARAIADLGNTVEHNTNLQRREDRWFQRSAFNNDLNADDAEALNDYLRTRGQAFLEEVDNWMAQRLQEKPSKNLQTSASHADGSDQAANQAVLDPNKRLGVGLYFFERDD